MYLCTSIHGQISFSFYKLYHSVLLKTAEERKQQSHITHHWFISYFLSTLQEITKCNNDQFMPLRHKYLTIVFNSCIQNCIHDRRERDKELENESENLKSLLETGNVFLLSWQISISLQVIILTHINNSVQKILVWVFPEQCTLYVKPQSSFRYGLTNTITLSL